MQQTETYKLNLIETDDVFSPAALNENAKTLEAELARLDAAIGTVGTTCRIVTGTYKGTGTFGSGKATAIQFDQFPELLFVQGSGYYGLFLRGCSMALCTEPYYGSLWGLYTQWSSNGKVSWYHSNAIGAYSQLNTLDVTYTYTALFA